MGFEQYLSILKAAREQERLEASQPPVACPNDGTVLQSGPNGELFCPFDGWRYDG